MVESKISFLEQSASHIDSRTVSSESEIHEKELKEAEVVFQENGLLVQFPELEHLLRYQDPVTDERLRLHREADRVPPLYGMHLSTCSWSHTRRDTVLSKWRNYQVFLLKWSEKLKSTEQTEELVYQFNQEWQERKKREFSKYFHKKADYLSQVRGCFPESLRGEGQLVAIGARSGGDALGAAAALIGLEQGEGTLTTEENGSRVYSILGSLAKASGGHYTELRLRNKFSNELLPTSQLLSQIKDAVENQGTHYISLTLASKTGERYDKESPGEQASLAQQILDFVHEYNQFSGHRPVYVMLDAVQLYGRVPLEEVFTLLEHPAAMGIVHTGSKAIGRTPHYAVSFFKQEIWQKIIDNWAHKPAELQAVVDEYGLLHEDLFSAGYGQDLFVALRGRDNLAGFHDLLTCPEELTLYGKVARDLAREYRLFFEYLGFICLDKSEHDPREIISILSFEPPAHIKPTDLKDRILPYLEGLGIKLGGYLQHGLVPIVRIGLPWEDIRAGLTAEKLRAQLYGDLSIDVLKLLRRERLPQGKPHSQLSTTHTSKERWRRIVAEHVASNNEQPAPLYKTMYNIFAQVAK